jgi:hypothetical protein
MTDIVAVLNNPNIVVSVDSTGNNPTVQSIGIQGPSSADSPLSANIEVDATGKTEGSVLVYKTATSKWTATTTLNAQNLEGGNY